MHTGERQRYPAEVGLRILSAVLLASLPPMISGNS